LSWLALTLGGLLLPELVPEPDDVPLPVVLPED
jgi:hypothetical protein